MNRVEIQAAFEDVFDQGVVYHGFTDYMRDYELVVYCTADPRTGVAPTHQRLLFTHCVRASITSALAPEIWEQSLGERLIEQPSEDQLDGYVWGTRWQALYPGLALLDESPEADRWSGALGLPFYQAKAEMNGHTIDLLFADLVVSTVAAGYTPFVVPSEGPDFKYPIL